MIESSKKSLAAFSFASPMRNSNSKNHRNIAEVFATICWFHELRIAAKVQTVAALQKVIDPVSDAQVDSALKRWQRYKNGKNTPSESARCLAENFHADSRGILESPLWIALRLDKPSSDIAKSLLGCAGQAGDELLIRMMGKNANHSQNRWLNKRCLAMQSSGSLEGLGVLTICMRLAGDAGHNHLVARFYYAICGCLLVLGSWFFNHGIAQGIADYYQYLLLPMCSNDQWTNGFSSGHYLTSIQSIQKMLQTKVEKLGRELNSKEIAEAVLKILRL